MILSFATKDLLNTASEASHVCAEETKYRTPRWHIIRTMLLQMDGGSQVVLRVLSQGA